MHAWNLYIFASLVSDCGKVIKVDEVSSENLWVDYARIMITTPTLSAIDIMKFMWVGGRKFTICLVDYFEVGLADDTCLVEYEDEEKP